MPDDCPKCRTRHPKGWACPKRLAAAEGQPEPVRCKCGHSWFWHRNSGCNNVACECTAFAPSRAARDVTTDAPLDIEGGGDASLPTTSAKRRVCA